MENLNLLMVEELSIEEAITIEGGIYHVTEAILNGIGIVIQELNNSINEDQYWYRSFTH